MTIHKSGTFEYEAAFTDEAFAESQILLRGTDVRGGNEPSLVGPSPQIKLWDGRMILIAAGQDKSSVRNALFPIGDVVTLAARPNDRLYLKRTACGGIGLSVLREGMLVVAFGVVTSVPLGPGLHVTRQPENNDNPTDTWLDFNVGSESLSLRTTDVAESQQCQIYVERCWAPGIPGTNECVAVCNVLDQRLRIAAIRSAVLLGNGTLKITHWDCAEHFYDL